MSEHIIQEIKGPVLSLRLNRAAKKNALTAAMYTALCAYLNTVATDDTIKAVVISGEGADFCAGNDIADFIQNSALQGELETMAVFKFLKAINYFPKPLIAAVKGQAVGVGTTLLLHCDLVYLADDARLSMPFVKLGLTPEAGSSRLLPHLIGHQRAFGWLALGEVVTADEALRLQLANAVVANVTKGVDAVLGKAMDAAQKLAQLSPSALCHTKALMRDRDATWAVITQEGHIFRQQLMSPEALQAFDAFMKKAG